MIFKSCRVRKEMMAQLARLETRGPRDHLDPKDLLVATDPLDLMVWTVETVTLETSEPLAPLALSDHLDHLVPLDLRDLMAFQDLMASLVTMEERDHL